MKILLSSPKADFPSFEVDHQISLALGILGAAAVKVRGAGRFGTNAATILLERREDAGKAIEALHQAGIPAEAAPIAIGYAGRIGLNSGHRGLRHG